MKKIITLVFPFFISSLYASGSPGVALVPAKWYVNNNSLTGDIFTTAIGSNANSGTPASPFATLEFAMGAAQEGDSIFIDAGTYITSDFTITKGVNFVGTNYKISPNNPADKLSANPAINVETIISGATLTLGASNISLLGLMLDAGNKIAIKFDNTGTSNDYGNFSFIKNRVKMNASFTQVVLIGTGTTATTAGTLVNSLFVFTDNRFEKFDNSTNSTFSVHLVKNVTISDNSFVVTGTINQTQTALNVGNGGIVDQLLVTNNFIDKARYFLLGDRFRTATFSGNIISRTNNVMQVNNQVAGTSDFQFINNLIDGSTGLSSPIFFMRISGAALGSTNNIKFENNTFNITAASAITTQLTTLNINIISTVLNPFVLIRGNKITYSGNLNTVEGQNIRPIVIRGNLVSAVVDNNEISLTGTNLQPANPAVSLPVCPAISLYSDNGSDAFIPAGANINILNNKVAGFKQSFVIYDPINAAGNGNPYQGYGNLAPNIAVNVNNNSFTGDSMSINNGTMSSLIEATCNWYGSSAVQNIMNKLSLETGNFVPWLSNGTDNNASVGFQPGTGVCNGEPMFASLDGFTNISTCPGAATGSIQISVSGGLSPYTYAWRKDGSPGFSSTVQDPTNLTAGTYHVTVTDALGSNILFNANGDPFTIDVTITQPPLLTANASGTNVNCSTSTNGTATVTAGGGTSPYSYNWSNGGTTQNISNLLPGIYTVTVTDAHNCTVAGSYTVTPDPSAPAAPVISAGSAITFCTGGSVTLTSTASSGNQWYKDGVAINGSTSTTFNATSSGSYIARVIVGNCTSTASNTIAVTVNPTPSTPVISQNGNALQSSAASGNQWYLNAGIIGGAVNQNYTPTLSGLYTVKVTLNNCASAFSADFNFILTALPNLDVFDNHIKVFPNPVQDNLVISQSGPATTLNIRLLDMQGRELRKLSTGLSQIDIDMKKYEAGTYIIWIEDTRNKVKGKKLIVKL